MSYGCNLRLRLEIATCGLTGLTRLTEGLRLGVLLVEVEPACIIVGERGGEEEM